MKGNSSSKKIYNNNNKEKENELLNKEISNEIQTNHFTDTKIKTNHIFDNIIRKKTYQLNLLKSFNDALQNPENKSTNKINNTNINNNISTHALKPGELYNYKNKYSSYKRAINLNDKEKDQDKNITAENNSINHRFFYFSKNNNDINKLGNANNSTMVIKKNKYDTQDIFNENRKKEKEPQNSSSKKIRFNKYNNNDIKRKYSHYLFRSNTESNYYN